ncbi:MAG: transposase, partial [Sulfolobaceae archaeon]
ISLLMTGSAHEVLGVMNTDGRVVVFPSTSPNDLRVTVYDPLRGVPVAELEVIKSKDKLRHG